MPLLREDKGREHYWTCGRRVQLGEGGYAGLRPDNGELAGLLGP